MSVTSCTLWTTIYMNYFFLLVFLHVVPLVAAFFFSFTSQLSSPFLKLLVDLAALTMSGNWFHLSPTLIDQKCFLVSSLPCPLSTLKRPVLLLVSLPSFLSLSYPILCLVKANEALLVPVCDSPAQLPQHSIGLLSCFSTLQ